MSGQTRLPGDSSTGPTSLCPHTARALGLPVTRDPLSTPYSSQVPSRPGPVSGPCAGDPTSPTIIVRLAPQSPRGCLGTDWLIPAVYLTAQWDKCPQYVPSCLTILVQKHDPQPKRCLQ